MLRRLNEAARAADTTHAGLSRLSLRPNCVRDVEGVVFWTMLHIRNAYLWRLVVHYFQWNIDSNSNNGLRLP